MSIASEKQVKMKIETYPLTCFSKLEVTGYPRVSCLSGRLGTEALVYKPLSAFVLIFSPTGQFFP